MPNRQDLNHLRPNPIGDKVGQRREHQLPRALHRPDASHIGLLLQIKDAVIDCENGAMRKSDPIPSKISIDLSKILSRCG